MFQALIHLIQFRLYYRSGESFLVVRLTSSLRIYNQLHILAAQITLCLRKVSFPSVLVGVVVMNVLGTSLTILLGTKLHDHVRNLFFPLGTNVSTVFTIVFGTSAGFVNKWSTKCLFKFRKSCAANSNKIRRNVLKRVFRSCAPMKIRFGNNFMAI